MMAVQNRPIRPSLQAMCLARNKGLLQRVGRKLFKGGELGGAYRMQRLYRRLSRAHLVPANVLA